MLFKGLTAWFSTSVTKKWITVWILQGGKIESNYNALFLFSEGNTTSDIKALLESKNCQEYVVLHPRYIGACISQNRLIPIKVANCTILSKDTFEAFKNKINHNHSSIENKIVNGNVIMRRHPIKFHRKSIISTTWLKKSPFLSSNFTSSCSSIDWGLFLRSVGYVESSMLGKAKNDLEFINISSENCPYSVVCTTKSNFIWKNV
ncbi:uncharacterized protein [Centruroides vittatus]|uniref:uncharacterized protein n=1 Tax=Centruroides vittatus TaxID=120091 RepID=UPI00350E9F15